MEPLEILLSGVIEMGVELGLSREEVIQRLTARMTKQSRYQWRKRIESVGFPLSTAACPFTGNFLEDLDL